MAAGAVTFLLIKFTELVQEEEKLLTRDEAQYIRDELAFMNQFQLQVTDAKEDTDTGLVALARQVRETAYEMENALDDYKLRVVRDHGEGFYAPLRKTYSSVATLFARRQIVKKMQRCQSRVQNASEAYRRYFNHNNLPLEQDHAGSTSNSTLRLIPARLGDALLVEEASLVGIENRKRRIIGWLLGSELDREVVSVVGPGGLGKTALVKKAYDAAEVKAHFVYRAWVTLSHSFKMEELLKNMIRQLFSALKHPIPQGMDGMDCDQLRTIIKEFLEDKRYLIVLDDVWHVPDWVAFESALPINSRGGRVLLTTRHATVAYTCCVTASDKVYRLNELSQENAWTLFCKCTFQSSLCPEHLRDVSHRILARLEGMPLAIKAISGVLATKDPGGIDEWEKVYNGLGNVLEVDDRLERTKQVLLIGYHDLPCHLKFCLMYFSVFPEAEPIEQMRLVRLWMAEGFVQPTGGMTLEEVATEYLNELINRSLVQVVEETTDGRIKTCRISHLLREVMISKARKQGFATIVNEQSTTIPESVRRLSLHKATPKRSPSQLRSVLVFQVSDSTTNWSLLKFSSRRLRLLNVLELRGAPLDKFPKAILSLSLLKYLGLRSTRVSSIPKSIKKLKKLETLDLKHAPVKELPTEISELQELRHLLVYYYDIPEESDDQVPTKCGFKAPSQLAHVQSLQKLCFLESNSEVLIALTKLKQLRRLGILKLKKEDGRSLCCLVAAQDNLRVLTVTSTDEREVIDLEHMTSIPKLLQRLYLRGRLEKLPRWVSSLDNLAKLVLKWSRLSKDPLVSLQNLPNLLHLELEQAYVGDTMTFKGGGFPRLKFLGLNKIDSLERIFVGMGTMRCLQELIVECCQSLKMVPYGIKFLKELKALKFLDMPYEFIARLNLDEGNDQHKVRNVPEVQCTYQINGIWYSYSVDSCRGGGPYDSPDRAANKRQHKWKEW